MTSPRIAPLTAADMEAARAIGNHYIEHSTANFNEEPLTADEFRALVTYESSRHCAFGIHDDGLAGYLLVSPFHSRCGYRDTAEVTVYLAPDRSGRGLGRAALAFAEEFARTQAFHALLGAICTENTASLRLFEAAGFTEVGRLREIGRKFGRLLDVAYVEKLLDDGDG